MKKTIIAMLIMFILMVSVGVVVAANNKKQDKEVELPYNDLESASYTKYHGNGIWSTTNILRKDDVKASKPVKTTGPTCYKLMGVSWSDTPDYVTQSQDLLSTVTTSIGTWNDATAFTLLGDGYVDPTVNFEEVMNGQNSYSYGDYPLTGVIAVCRTWRDSFGNILEYDIMFDTDFTWGDATINPGVMDLQNIATHEIGHAFGLSDIYNRPCNTQTMYGYSSEGDTSKRTLEAGDILGIQTLYG